MLDFIQQVANWVQANWHVLVALCGGGATLSIILQYVLHKFHIDSKKLAYTLLNLLSFGAAASAYYLQNTKVLPVYAGLMIAAQTAHRFFVSPYYNKYVVPYLTFLSESQPATPAVETPQVAPVEATSVFVN